MSQKTTNILKKLEEGVQSLLNSDTYLEFLKYMATLPHYSLNNQSLIYFQCKQRNIVPSILASYSEWRKRHRHIIRGEKGIKIIAPHIIKDGKNLEEKTEKIGFHLATTFDISQTEPDDEKGEIQQFCHLLEGDLTDRNLITNLVKICPIHVSFAPISEEDVNGYFNSKTDEIVVDNTNSEVQQVKTFMHELSHYWHYKFDQNFEKCSREVREIVAESSAYVVLQNLKIPIDSALYSFGYLASYSKDSFFSEFKQNLSLINRIADKIITDLDNLYAENKKGA